MHTRKIYTPAFSKIEISSLGSILICSLTISSLRLKMGTFLANELNGFVPANSCKKKSIIRYASTLTLVPNLVSEENIRTRIVQQQTEAKISSTVANLKNRYVHFFDKNCKKKSSVYILELAFILVKIELLIY